MNYEEIKKIIDDMGNSKIDELEIEFPEGMKISMKKNTGKENIETNKTQTQQKPEETTNTSKTQEKNTIEEQEKYKIIKSPMVGTFYSRPSPTKESFTKVGEKIKKGQVICIVEAMKLMNEIESEFDGEVAEICIKDGEIVEYGMPLFKIK